MEFKKAFVGDDVKTVFEAGNLLEKIQVGLKCFLRIVVIFLFLAGFPQPTLANDLKTICSQISAEIDFSNPKPISSSELQLAGALIGKEVLLIFYDSRKNSFGVQMGTLRSTRVTRGAGISIEIEASPNQAAVVAEMNRLMSARHRFEELKNTMTSGGLGSKEFLVDITDLNDQQSKIQFNSDPISKLVVEVVADESSLEVGKHNSTEAIKNLTAINGRPISELERAMRPGRDSMAGFLGPKESLLEILAKDNEFIISRGLTHGLIADTLDGFKESGSLDARGYSFKIKVTSYRGDQESPFKERLSHF